LVAVVGAFILSGILHLAGLRATVDDTHAGGWGSLYFFALQPLGILIEMATQSIWTRFPRPAQAEKILRIVEVAAGWIWILGWFTLTSRWFFDEFAWGGVWRVEATPVSLWQEGWWRWGAARGADGIGGATEDWRWWEWSDGGKGWGVVI